MFAFKLSGTLLASVVALTMLPVLGNEPLGTATPVFWAADRPESADRIYEVLRQPLTSKGLEFADAPIEQVVRFLRDEYEIEIQLDMTALDDLGISHDDPVTVNIRNISLGSALHLMLQQLDLTTIVTDGVLLVTSEDEALSRLKVAVYPVGDLLQPVDTAEHMSGAAARAIYSPLLNVITCCVAPDSWQENGVGEGDLRILQPGLLVVSQTQDVHAEISGLLRAIRSAKSHELANSHKHESNLSSGSGTGRGGFGRGFGGGGGGFGYGGSGGGFGFGGVEDAEEAGDDESNSSDRRNEADNPFVE